MSSAEKTRWFPPVFDSCPGRLSLDEQFFVFAQPLGIGQGSGRQAVEKLVHQPVELWEDSIASLQNQLREAVENSLLLQAQSEHFEDGWIENTVKVHVNITQPPDPTFWSSELFPFFMGLPDTPMRDHRKIALYDISERDPYKGRAIYTGMGIGEHYIGAGWEDRAIMAEGPVLLW